MTCCSQRPYLWLFAILGVVGFVTDQTTKYIVFAKLYPDERSDHQAQDIIPGYFELRTNFTLEDDASDGHLSFLRTLGGTRVPHVNKGALFGIGNDGGGMNTFFAAISILAAGFITFWATRASVARDRFLCLALGLILGGTLGNLYDRIVFGGVRDFLHCYYDTHIWPDFNIADCCLVCGAGVLLVHSFFVSDHVPQSTTPEAAAAEAPMQTTSSPNGV